MKNLKQSLEENRKKVESWPSYLRVHSSAYYKRLNEKKMH